MQSCDNIHVDPIKDISDGAVAKDNAMLRDPEALKLVLYYDDIEICNPLGSKKKKHKLGECICAYTCKCTSEHSNDQLHCVHYMYMLQVLTIVYCYASCNSNVFIVLIGMFYFTFGNTSSLQRSKLSSIHLVAIARTALLKKYSMNKIIQPIVKELKTLVSYKHCQIMTLNIFITGARFRLGRWRHYKGYCGLHIC